MSVSAYIKWDSAKMHLSVLVLHVHNVHVIELVYPYMQNNSDVLHTFLHNMTIIIGQFARFV